MRERHCRTTAAPTSITTSKDYDRAIADYSEAIRLNPKYATAYNNRGLGYKQKGDYDRAIADFNDAIRLDPKYAIAYDNRGDVYAAKRDHDHAIADYSDAIRLDPKNAIYYNDRGEIYRTKGDNDRAIEGYDLLIGLQPSSANWWNYRCWDRAILDRLEPAMADCNEGVKLKPDGSVPGWVPKRGSGATDAPARPHPALTAVHHHARAQFASECAGSTCELRNRDTRLFAFQLPNQIV